MFSVPPHHLHCRDLMTAAGPGDADEDVRELRNGSAPHRCRCGYCWEESHLQWGGPDECEEGGQEVAVLLSAAVMKRREKEKRRKKRELQCVPQLPCSCVWNQVVTASR